MPLTTAQRRALERLIRDASQTLAQDDEHHTPRGARRRLNEATLNLLRSAAHFGEWHWFAFAFRVWVSGQVRIGRAACVALVRRLA